MLHFRFRDIASRLGVKKFCINPFTPNVSFLYPLKTSENIFKTSKHFQGLEKGGIGNKWVKIFFISTKILLIFFGRKGKCHLAGVNDCN